MTPQRQTYYDLLGVDFDATQEEIRAASERQQSAHQDNPEMLKQIKLAWAELRSERSRAAYDKRNNIARLRRVRQQKLGSALATQVEDEELGGPPKTLVGAEEGLSVPQTIVGAGEGLSIPQTIVGTGKGLSIPKTIVRAAEGVSATPDQQSVMAESQEQAHPPVVVTLNVQPLSRQAWSRQLTIGEYIIGRQDEKKESRCDICFQDPDHFISRQHAILLVKPHGCFVRAAPNSNGTFVNGYLIRPGQEAMLNNDDKISIEGRILTLHIQQNPDAQ